MYIKDKDGNDKEVEDNGEDMMDTQCNVYNLS